MAGPASFEGICSGCGARTMFRAVGPGGAFVCWNCGGIAKDLRIVSLIGVSSKVRPIHKTQSRRSSNDRKRRASHNTRRFSFESSVFADSDPRVVDEVTIPLLFGYEDESGDLGKRESSSDRLISAIVVTDDPEYLAHVIGSYPPNSKGYKHSTNEVKFSNSIDTVRLGVLQDGMRCHPRIYAVVTDKRSGLPYRSGPSLLIDTLGEAVQLASEHEDGVLRMTFDQHRSLNRSDADRICTEATSNGRAVVECSDHAGKSADSPALQFADMVVGSIARRYNEDYPRIIRKRYWNVIRRNTVLKER